MKQRKIKMFKKTLLALSVAAVASTAGAATLSSTSTNSLASAANFVVGDTGAGLAGEALGVIAGAVGDVLSTAGFCDQAAADLKVTLDETVAVSDGNADTHSVSRDNAGVLNTTVATSVKMTTTTACEVIIGTVNAKTSDKSPIEAPAGTVSIVATIQPGIGGYKIEDTLTLNFTGADIDTTLTTAPKLMVRGGQTLEVLDITSSTIRFTVPSGGADVLATEILDLSLVTLDSSGLSAATDVKLDTFATNTSGTKYDVAEAVSVHGLVPQYSAAVDYKFNGIIDVSADRQSLVKSATTDTIVDLVDTDTLRVDVDLKATTNFVAPSDITFEIKGDFAWLNESADTTADGKAATAAEIATYLGDYMSIDGGATKSAPDSSSLNKELTSLFITTDVSADETTPAEEYDFTLTVEGEKAGNPVLNEQDFTVSVSIDDGVAAPKTNVMTAATDAAAGSWALNGSVITIPYMPFDANTAVILRHTNTGVQTGDLSVRYMLEGVSTSWETVGIVGTSSRGVANIRDIVMNAITADAGVTAGKVAIEIVTNVPDADVTVYAAYKVRDEKDRGFVGTFGKHGSAQ
jgi:hypothetical protein